MNLIWILVANQSEAQIYSSKQFTGNLTLLHTLTHAEASAHTRELTTDAPGRVHDRIGSARHSIEPETGIKEEGRRRFVKEMVDLLEAARQKGDFKQLVVLAAPAVLGVIRKSLTDSLSRIIAKEIPKDVIGQDKEKIQTQLKRAFELK